MSADTITRFDHDGIPLSKIYFTRMVDPKVPLQAAGIVYTPLKDLRKYLKDKNKFVKDLEDNLTKLICEMATFYFKKEKVDRKLDTTMLLEKSGEYLLLVKQMEIYHKKYGKLVDKYQAYCQNLPSLDIQDGLSATNLIDIVHERKPTILTKKFFKLAKLSKMITELLGEISIVNSKMQLENVTIGKEIDAEQEQSDIDLPSSAKIVSRILRYLSQEGNRSLGISGPIGVGKTTILKKLNNAASSYDVIKIDCSEHDPENKNVKLIQDTIMGQLRLEEKDKTNNTRKNAWIISSFLRKKKHLLLFDQVSSTIDFHEVGINNDNGVKVVVASSSKKVIRSMTDEQIEINPMSYNDALDLFLKVCGKIEDKRINLIARNIVRFCGGLPLMIKLVAYHLKGQKNEEVWSDVKRLMQITGRAKLKSLEGVRHAYKVVYDKLEKIEKKCLLFLTLFPNDHKIHRDYIIECWNAERFFELDILELRVARERGATTLRELTDQYLLDHSDKYVQMPEYFRKVAAEQEYPDENNFLTWMPQENHQPLTHDIWRKTKRMSLIGYKSKLPSQPRSDNISTLLMQCYSDKVALGDQFFDHMPKLLILDLQKTYIESPPKSISNLANLRNLYLNDCSRELPPKLEKLEKLELLDIRGTSIRSLPNQVGDMFHLKCLRISFGQTGCYRNGKRNKVDMMIPLNLISRLYQLEELTIEVGCCNQAWSDIADQIVDEVAYLEKLSTLNFHFPNVSIFEKFVAESKSLKNTDTYWSTNTLRSFNISIGCCEKQLPHGLEVSGISGPERRLRFSTIDEEISSVKEVLRQANLLELVGHCGVESLNDLDLTNAGTLKVCVVGYCKNMTSIVDDFKTGEEITKKIDCALLQCLEKLHLFELEALQSIWKPQAYFGSLANLKDLTLSGCSKITTIINHKLAIALSSLEYIKVDKCSKVVAIIDEEIATANMLDKVMTIELVELPMLRSICKTDSIKWKHMED